MGTPPASARPRVPLAPALGPTHVVHAPVVESAGALVWRVRGGRLQVRLVHRPKYRDWSWPKGKLDPGEAFQAAAAREVAEETGRPVVLGVPLPGMQYLLADGTVKRVHYWAGQVAGPADGPALAARAPVAPVSPEEIDKMEWLDADAAESRLTRLADRGPLQALVHEFHRGRLATHVVVIARHGKAAHRSAWYGNETDRPLTPTGHAQSAAIVPVLAAYGVQAVVTSRWDRCTQTIGPYARAAGLEPESADHLTEAQHERSPGRVARSVRALLESDRSAVLCTHRPVLPTVFDVLSQHARQSVAQALPVRDPFLEPGELVVAHVASTPKGPRVVAAEKVAPPMH